MSLSGLTRQSITPIIIPTNFIRIFLSFYKFAFIFNYMQKYYVYILSNQTNSTLYIGVTNDLKRRLYEHKNKLIDGFSSKYNTNKLVYFEETSDVKTAIQREKNLKKWNRQWKNELIEKTNPDYKDLSDDWE